MSYGNSEVSQLIFSACDPDGCGDIPVSRLMNYIDKEMQSCYDRSLLQQLKIMLLVPLGTQELRIQKESFDNIVKDWIAYVQDYKHSLSGDSEYGDYLTADSFTSDFLSPVSSPENSSYIRKKLEEKLADTELQRSNLLDENNKLKALLKDSEDAFQTLMSDHISLQDRNNVFEKKLQAFKTVQQNFQELETNQQTQQSTIQDLQSKVKCIEKENYNLEKSHSCLQMIVGTLKEEKTEAIKIGENLRKLLSEAKSEVNEMKLKFDTTLLKYDAEKCAMFEKLKDLEILVSDLKNTVVFLKEKNLDLEIELSKRKETYNPELEKCHIMWKNLDESLNDVSETLKLLSCEQESEALFESETNLRAELQASGNICLGHKKLEVELADLQGKLEVRNCELSESMKNLNFLNDAILKCVELLKMIQISTEGAEAFSDEMEKIADSQCTDSFKLLVLDLFAELVKVSMMVSNLMKTGSYSSTKPAGQIEMETGESETTTTNDDWSSSELEFQANGCNFFEVSHPNRRSLLNVTTAASEVDNSELSTDSTPNVFVTEGSGAFALSSDRNIIVRIVKFLLMCVDNFILYGGKILKLLMLLFFFWILFAVAGKLIYKCFNVNKCGCYDIGELFSPHVKMVHLSPPPV